MSHFFNIIFAATTALAVGFVAGFVAFPATKAILEDYRDKKLSEEQIKEAMNLANNLSK